MDIELTQALKEIADLKEDNREWEKANDKWRTLYFTVQDKLNMAREVILNLHNAGRVVLNNAGRVVLMCRAEKLAYEYLSVAISDIRIKQLLEGLEVKPDDRFEVTEKGKEYLSSH